MTDYTDFMLGEIAALRVNSGAARRAIYERTRGLFVEGSRHLDPSVAALEIIQLRLQLEDCIREVERKSAFR